MDGTIIISVGKHRKDKQWKQRKTSWSAFVDRLRATHRTQETHAEYLKLDRSRQDEIKDIGGYVGGRISGGRRLKSSVLSRSLVTLDADFATKNFWKYFTLQFNCAAACYSTHKHSPEKPRVRLVIPLNREVLCDEYMAICRKIADLIDMEMFDHTGFQPSRLMYWPSTSSDGEYYFKEQKGKALDADKILALYDNWQNIEEWALGTTEKKIIATDGKMQGEPADKPGLIGLFCRTYSILETAELHLSDVYEINSDTRMTYKAGSTSAGVVVYDDKFAYSHHSTDPACSVLCNAFDLVRLHKFAHLDAEGSDETPVNKRKSYLAMCDYVSSDLKVKRKIGEETMLKSKSAFDDVMLVSNEARSKKKKRKYIDSLEDSAEDDNGDLGGPGEDDSALAWLDSMDVDRKGNYLCTINNIALILEYDPNFLDSVAFNEFENQIVFRKKLPWRETEGGGGSKATLTDSDIANIENYIEKVYKFPAIGKVLKGMFVVGEKKRFHPVREYLLALRWDGKPRLESLFIKYLGAEDTLYVREVSRKSMVACVARVMEPGVKFDNVLTFFGKEGQGKSAMLDKLGGVWFNDTFSLHMLQGKEAYEQAQGVWIIEIGELAGMAKAEVEKVKSFISARSDRYRRPYDKVPEKRPRQCVFFASTNTEAFLKSQTGNRRFWPVATSAARQLKSPFDFSMKERDQVWAEAVYNYFNGETLFLSAEVLDAAEYIQDTHTEQNPMAEQIQAFLALKIPANWYEISKWDKLDILDNYEEKSEYVPRTKFCKYELWELVFRSKDVLGMAGLRQIEQAMLKVNGWSKEPQYIRFGKSYPRHRGSYKIDNAASMAYVEEKNAAIENKIKSKK